ncbi:alpha-E domain-containing protein [Gordonia sp. (in: high G+C Gram-positive bacteria)]|uniref:alpha-E domain-containing protein n=1 Tax=unclassified Gordonia (in: high G+C Gram-positive bacteria) TaxID=2657482 RepID=UPI00261396A2|nr:alpha-E domain-containing protein [Gordonia sp. (in: high G+C Gram-positive bacteria)]
MMLARNADSLFWVGRYVERADDMARILDVAVQQLLEDPTVDTDHTVRQVMAVLGFAPPDTGEPMTVWTLAEAVAYDRGAECSIVGLVKAARENARGAREVTSSEMWECLNATYNEVPSVIRRARKLGPHHFLSYIKARAAMFAGLTDATLSHDDGYSYLLLGRSIERIDMIVRMLHSRSGDLAASPSWIGVLIAAGAQDTYVRAYRGAVDADSVVRFMLLDRLFPRSVFYTLLVAESHLAALDHRPNRVGQQSRALTLLGRARSRLEFIDPDSMVEDLTDHLRELQVMCQAVTDSIAEEHFHIEPYVSWTGASLTELADRKEAQ